eukprot:5823885-Amphidinium_carterae.1
MLSIILSIRFFSCSSALFLNCSSFVECTSSSCATIGGDCLPTSLRAGLYSSGLAAAFAVGLT